MRIGHVSDLHYSPANLDESDRCLGYAIDQLIDGGCEAMVFSGDQTDHRLELHTPPVTALLRQVRRVAEHCPALMLQGTLTHEPLGTLNVFKTLGGRYSVYVADRITQVALVGDRWIEAEGVAFAALPEGCRLLCSVLPALNKGAVAAAVGAAQVGVATRIALEQLMGIWASVNRAAHAADIPTVVVTHGTVSGCTTEHGAALVSLDHEFTTGLLFMAEASAVMIGHIHQHQSWEMNGRRIAYAGNIGRFHYGEMTDKGCLLWQVGASKADFTFIPTPARRLIDVQFDGVPDMEQLRSIAATAEGAFVRVRYVIDEEHRHSVDRSALQSLFGAAAGCKIEARIAPVQRTRGTGMAQAATLEEKLSRWGEYTKTDVAPLLERLVLLASHDPDEIVRCIEEYALVTPPGIELDEDAANSADLPAMDAA